LRFQKKLTQEQVAQRLSVIKSVIATHEKLIQQTQLFQTSSDYLLGLKKTVVIDNSELKQEDVELI